MSTPLQIIAAIGAFSGWIVALIQFHQHYSRQARERNAREELLERREKAIKTVLNRYQEAHRQLVRQLEQAEIYFDIEQELANRLAEAAGGKPVTRKTQARAAVMERRGTTVPLIGRVTTPSGIGELKQRAHETMIETMKLDWQDDSDITRDRSAPSPRRSSPAAA